MKSRHLNALVLFAALTVFNRAYGACDNSANPIQISSSCEDLSINNTVTGVSIASSATVSAFFSTDAINIGTLGNVTDTLLNSGVISNGIYWNGLVNNGVINTLQNQGTITSSSRSGLINSGNIGTLSNTGAINSDASGNSYGAIVNNNQIGALNNSGTISATVGTFGNGAYAIQQNGHIGTLNNSGVISAQNNAIYFQPAFSSRIDTLINSGTIQGGVNGSGSSTFASAIVLGVANSIGTITNTGTIDHSVCSGGTCYAAIENNGGSIGAITNQGTLTSGNTGSTGYGIINGITGAIDTLNNLQGAGNSAGSLTYRGVLPTNYNIIINSPTSFGRLDVTGGAGLTTFGIYTGSKVSNGTYSSVLSGITLSNVTSTTGTFGSATWLLSNSSGTIWDLVVSGYYSGPSTADTQQSLVNTAQVLQGTFTLQNTVLANSFSYDCNEFGANGICISAGGRNTAVSAANGLNNTSGLLIAAYRPHANYRVGAYVDQNLSVNNAGSTVNLGNNTPLIGLFGAWNARLDGTGTEVKVSVAYGQKNTTITRQVVGTSEAGSGSSQLNSQGAQVIAKYGFGVADNVIVSPYVGIRYTQNNMGSYTEGTSATVTAPLTYSALNTNATTALAGVGASYKVIPSVTTFASAGIETDTNTANGSYSGTNSSISGLTPVNFNANPVRTRPTATLGAYYDVAKNQRLGVTGIYRQEAYQAVQTTTVMATYTVGL